MNKSKLDPKKEIIPGLVTVTPIEEVIKNEIQKFDVKEKDIDTAVEAYRTLKIAGIDDKDGYEAVSQARVVFRNMRTAIEKRRKELKEDSLKIGRAIDTEAARLTNKFVDTEKLLAGYVQEIDEEKERIKREEKERVEREKRERIESRVSSLRTIGFTWSGGAFYDFDGDNPITTVEIDEMVDDDFNAFMFKHKARYNEWVIAEEKRKTEEARIKAEEDVRRKAEEDRLAKERAELEVLAKARRLEEEQLAKQRKELEEEKAKVSVYDTVRDNAVKKFEEEQKNQGLRILAVDPAAEVQTVHSGAVPVAGTVEDGKVKISVRLNKDIEDILLEMSTAFNSVEYICLYPVEDSAFKKILDNVKTLIEKTSTYFDTEVKKWQASQKLTKPTK